MLVRAAITGSLTLSRVESSSSPRDSRLILFTVATCDFAAMLSSMSSAMSRYSSAFSGKLDTCMERVTVSNNSRHSTPLPLPRRRELYARAPLLFS